MFSVYTQFYNVEKFNIDFKSAITNFCEFLTKDDEVVITVNTSEDNTLNKIITFVASLPVRYPNVEIVPCDFSYNDIEFDGKVKNHALQATHNSIKIQMDGDERFDLNQKDQWRKAGKSLEMNKEYISGWMMNSLDLWGSLKHARKNQPIGVKFRMHIGGIQRGVQRTAWSEDGKSFDTSKSDSTEPIDKNGDLIQNFAHFPDLYTLHLGYVDYSYREEIDKFWNPHWTLRSGNEKKEDAVTKESLAKVEICEHNLHFKI